MEKLITVDGLTVTYNEKPVLWNVSTSIVENSITAIVGPNGAGKSTLIKSIMGMVEPLAGDIKINGQSLKKMFDQVAYVPQKSDVDWDFPTTVLDVVLMGRYVHKGWIKRYTKADVKRAEEALETMRMSDFKHRQISELSGGQRQRVFLSRAIAQDADIYIMDEPLQGIDVVTERLIMQTIHDLQQRGKTFVVVHHNLATVEKYFDHVIILNKEVVAQGTIEEAWTKENVATAYDENSVTL